MTHKLNRLKKIINRTNFVILLLILILIAIVSNIYKLTNSPSNPQVLKQDNLTETPIQEVSNVNAENFELLKILDCLKETETQQQCLDAFMKEYGETREIPTILSDIETGRTLNLDFENQCHPITHAAGRVAFDKYGNVGDAFEVCDQTCHSGCYHGVMERLFFTDAETSSANKHLNYDDFVTKIPGICSSDKFKNPSNSVIFQCLHGVGHAILYSIDYDLVEALKVCDLLSTHYEKSSCYGGVFMENVTAFDKSKRAIKPGEYHYPCNMVGESYRYDCYQMQTSIMSELGLNAEAMAKECQENAVSGNVHPCLVSIGRDTSNSVRVGNIEYARAVCEDYVSKGHESCIQGVVYALIDNTWDETYAYKYCDALLGTENKKDCFEDSNSYLKSVYNFTKSNLENKCDSYSGETLTICKDAINAM